MAVSSSTNGADTPFADITHFGSLIGALQYLAIIDPDIQFAVNRVAQRMHQPSEHDYHCLKTHSQKSTTPANTTTISAVAPIPFSPPAKPEEINNNNSKRTEAQAISRRPPPPFFFSFLVTSTINEPGVREPAPTDEDETAAPARSMAADNPLVCSVLTASLRQPTTVSKSWRRPARHQQRPTMVKTQISYFNFIKFCLVSPISMLLLFF
uniref:Reverse transcriptase Ty1/copia-type domain-containing protein n=1 Tax=Solanum lycopersicum TaxID=4081 RepID=A0A3Q7H8E4_SOLLC